MPWLSSDRARGQVDLSFVCPVHNKKPYLAALVASLVSQDIWARCELIAVENESTDGSWEELRAIVRTLPPQARRRIRLIRRRQANACLARNAGMKVARGKYVSFLPADAVLYPGWARTWIEALDNNPQYGFVYGGYRLEPPGHIEVLESQEFDLERLKQGNYIDGSFPLRRELYPWWNNGGYDPDIKSLQDWDFWLAVVLGKNGGGSGVAGLFLPGYAFAAAPPQPGGLTEDARANWQERVRYIQRKWAILPQTHTGD